MSMFGRMSLKLVIHPRLEEYSDYLDFFRHYNTHFWLITIITRHYNATVAKLNLGSVFKGSAGRLGCCVGLKP